MLPAMFNRLIATTLLTSVSFGAAPALAGDAHWYADFDEAQKAAAEEGKDMLVDFTGSDWCGWCIKLHEEVFDHEEWQKGVAEDYILVALDFPNDPEIKAKVPNPERNQELQQVYGVQGFPTILLMTNEGEVYGRTGYQAGGPTAYLEHMAELRTVGRKALTESKAIVKSFEDAKDDAGRWKSWDTGVELLEQLDSESPFAATIAEVVAWGFETDAENKKGARLRSAVALLTSGQQADEHMSYVEESDPLNAKGYLELVVEARFGAVQDEATARNAVKALAKLNEIGFKNTELAFDLNFQVVRWAKGPLQDDEIALAHAKVCKELGSEDARAMGFIDSVLNEG